jgi:hypothetical protein
MGDLFVVSKKTRIREARTVEELREAVVERWHKIYRAAPPSPSAEEILSRRPTIEREGSRFSRLAGSGGRPGRPGGGFFGHRPTFDDDFDE